MSEAKDRTEPDKVKRAILYLITHMRPLTHFELQKMLFSIDMISIQEHLRRQFEVKYMAHKHGMFSMDISDALNELVDEGKIRGDKNPTQIYSEQVDGELYQPIEGNEDTIEPELKEAMDEYIEEFKNAKSWEIKNFAVEFPPYQRAKHMDLLKIDEYLEEVRYYNSQLPDRLRKIAKDTAEDC
jgi:uncharacterized protein YwgA